MTTTRAVLTPLSAEFPSANFPQLLTVNERPALGFDASTDETAYWTLVAPQGLTGTMTAVLTLMGNAAGTNSTYWEVAVEAITSADATDLDAATSFDTVNTGNTAMPTTQGHIVQLSITMTNQDSVAAADYLRISVTRDANNASDNFAADAYLLAVELRDAA
jgi:hypothetical protein